MFQTNLAVTKDTQFVIQTHATLINRTSQSSHSSCDFTGASRRPSLEQCANLSGRIQPHRNPGYLEHSERKQRKRRYHRYESGAKWARTTWRVSFPELWTSSGNEPLERDSIARGKAASTLEINATSAQVGEYQISVTGSAILAPSQSVIVTAQVTGPPGQPSTSPPSSSPPPSTTNPNNQQPSTTTSGSNPKGPSTTRGQGQQSVFDPVGVIVTGNLLAAVGTVGALASMYRKRTNPSRVSS